MSGCKILCSALAAALLAMSGATAEAGTIGIGPTQLAPGGTASPLPDFVDSGGPGGLVVVRQKTDNFSVGNVSGILTEFVVANTAASPYGAGDLAFAFAVNISSDFVTSINLPGFAGFQTAVKVSDISSLGSGTVPTAASRSGGNGDTATFIFGTPAFNTGSFTVYTDATGFVDPTASINLQSGGTLTLDVLGPATVPEPSTWTMLIVGLAGIGLLAYHRRSRIAARFDY